MKTKIFVIYVGVQGLRSEDIEDFVKKISTRITPTTFDGEIIVIPTQSPDTRIECINPTYITDVKLIKQHTESMERLNTELNHQSEQLKQKNNE